MPNGQDLTDKIAQVIRGLDHGSPCGDANWSEEGEVRISIVRDALGGLAVTRDDIRATGLLRVIPAANTEDDPTAEAAAFARHRQGQRGHGSAPVGEPKTVAEAEVAVNAAQVAVDHARNRLIAAEKNGIRTRAKWAETIKAWVAQFPPRDQNAVYKEHCERLAAHKAAGKLEQQNVSTAGRSPLDQFAAATSAKGRGAGQGDAFRRGASSRRLPSQR
jgi:hypothetical protein